MRNTLSLFGAIALIAFSTSAFAGDVPSKDDVKAAKAELKIHQDNAKDVAKLSDKWAKAAEKDDADKMADLNAELVPVVRDQLDWLRSHGVKTNDDATPAPAAPPTEWLRELPEDQPKMEALRDTLVALRDLAAKTPAEDMRKKEAAHETELLGTFSSALDERAERKEKQYDALKEASKG